MMFTATVYVLQRLVVQAVPFWIVKRSSEIADREKTVTNERRGAWGEAGKRGKEKKLSSGGNVLKPMPLPSFPHNPILKFDICFYSIVKL